MPFTLIGQAAALAGFDKFLFALFQGLAQGAIYALLALGFVLIFKATQVFNFAQGAIMALGAYLIFFFGASLEIPGKWIPGPSWLDWVWAVVFASAAAAILALLLERVFLRPMIGEPLFSIAVITIGLDIAIRTLTNDFINVGLRPIGTPWGNATFKVGNVNVFWGDAAAFIAMSVLVFALALFFRTRMGIAMRATAFDQEAAMAQGIGVGRVFATSWAIAAVLATIAGIFVASFPKGVGVDTNTALIALSALPAVILGGIDSITGAVVGGLLLGLVQVFAGVYLLDFSDVLGSGFSAVVPYAVMVIVLLIRPFGLFGTEEIRRI
jgi:branched-chain amino acid transport system permease protein